MSLVKTAGQAMQYERTGTKQVKDGKRVAVKFAEQLSTSSILWLLVKRHKVGLLAIGNIILIMNFVFPEWPQLLLSLIGR